MPDQFDVAIMGLGYVGLRLARACATAGLTVAGYEIEANTVRKINAGQSHVDGVSDADIHMMRSSGFRPTGDPEVLGRSDVVVICVPTPLAPDGSPDLSAVRAAARDTAAFLRRGMLVIMESTSYPGTTEEVVRPLLEEGSGLTAGEDFHLASSPERIDPGNHRHNLNSTPKVVGGLTPACAAATAAFYRRFVQTVIHARGCREAELAKIIENSYRYVNIALINEISILAHEFGIDVWNAIDCAATKPFGFHAFYPGPGAGGHCIPVDPNYFAHKAGQKGMAFRFAELANEINEEMPGYVVDRAETLLHEHGKALGGATVLLLGVTYKPNIADLREAPSVGVLRALRERGAGVGYHDPYVEEWTVDGDRLRCRPDLHEALRKADLTILLQDHAAYDIIELTTTAQLFLDTRGSVRGQAPDNSEVL